MIAHIKLYENGQKMPFYTGYRPLFNFINNMKTSGQINLIHQDQFNPGEDGEVEITFLNQNYLGEDFEVGKTFYFGEGMAALGEGLLSQYYSIKLKLAQSRPARSFRPFLSL